MGSSFQISSAGLASVFHVQPFDAIGSAIAHLPAETYVAAEWTALELMAEAGALYTVLGGEESAQQYIVEKMPTEYRWAYDRRKFVASFLDRQTPRFSDLYHPKKLARRSAEVLDVLASAETTMNLGEVAKGVRGGQKNAVAVQIGRLEEQRLIHKIQISPRCVQHEVESPLFRLWRLFRMDGLEHGAFSVFTPAQMIHDLFTDDNTSLSSCITLLRASKDPSDYDKFEQMIYIFQSRLDYKMTDYFDPLIGLYRYIYRGDPEYLLRCASETRRAALMIFDKITDQTPGTILP